MNVKFFGAGVVQFDEIEDLIKEHIETALGCFQRRKLWHSCKNQDWCRFSFQTARLEKCQGLEIPPI